jgi:hypothetical protein
MKKYIFVLFVLIASSQISLAKQKVDKDAKIDSLTKANAALSEQLDTVSKEMAGYKELYTVLRDRVVKHDFDPTRASLMIDSVYALEKEGAASNAVLRDSLTYYKNENMQLKSTIQGVSQPESANNRLVYELKMLKDLLDSKIITQGEFDVRKTIVFQKWQ